MQGRWILDVIPAKFVKIGVGGNFQKHLRDAGDRVRLEEEIQIGGATRIGSRIERVTPKRNDARRARQRCRWRIDQKEPMFSLLPSRDGLSQYGLPF